MQQLSDRLSSYRNLGRSRPDKSGFYGMNELVGPDLKILCWPLWICGFPFSNSDLHHPKKLTLLEGWKGVTSSRRAGSDGIKSMEGSMT